MSTYPAGTVAVATVRGVKDMRVMRRALFDGRDAWFTPDCIGDFFSHQDSVVTDIRPLVVLDLNGLSDALRDLPKSLRRVEEASHGAKAAADSIDRNRLMGLIRQIEAQTQSPRIPEPGLWGVVTGRQANTAGVFDWVNTPVKGWTNHHGYAVSWDDLIDPTLIREGLS